MIKESLFMVMCPIIQKCWPMAYIPLWDQLLRCWPQWTWCKCVTTEAQGWKLGLETWIQATAAAAATAAGHRPGLSIYRETTRAYWESVIGIYTKCQQRIRRDRVDLCNCHLRMSLFNCWAAYDIWSDAIRQRWWNPFWLVIRRQKG